MINLLVGYAQDATEGWFAITTDEADLLLRFIEKAGMKPPCVDGDKCQALMHVYIDPSFNMWDEDFEKDPKLVAAYERRMNRTK
jgi:hypothetical protein